MSEEGKVQRLPRPDGNTVAYAKTEGRAPTVAFLGGFRSDMGRAGTGDNNSTWPKMFDRGTSEPMIAVERSGTVRLAFGHGRRIKDDQIKFALILTQPFKRVGLDQLMPAGANRGNRLVQRKIPSR